MLLVILLCDLSICPCIVWSGDVKNTWKHGACLGLKHISSQFWHLKSWYFTTAAWKDYRFSFPIAKPFWVPLQLSTHWLCGKPAQLTLQQKEHPIHAQQNNKWVPGAPGVLRMGIHGVLGTSDFCSANKTDVFWKRDMIWFHSSKTWNVNPSLLFFLVVTRAQHTNHTPLARLFMKLPRSKSSARDKLYQKTWWVRSHFL